MFWKTCAGHAGLIGAAIGALVLLGWMLDIAVLKSINPGWVTMKANTAVGFVLTGSAVWMKARDAALTKPLWRILEQALAGLAVLLGLLTLFEYLAGIDLGIDLWLFLESADSIGTLSPGRMAPAAALCFVLLGSALLLSGGSVRTRPYISLFALMTALLALSSGLIYLYDTDNSYGLGQVMQLAAHTALAFILLALATLCLQPEEGVVALLRRQDSGGAIIRRLLPIAVFLPILLGWLTLIGERSALYEPDFGIALIALSYIVILSMLVTWSARFLSRIDAERERVNATVAMNEARLRTLIRSIPDPVWLKDTAGVYLLCNPPFERFFGAQEANIAGKTDYDFVPREQADSFRANDQAAIAAGASRSNEEWLTFADGQHIWVETTKTPIFDPQGKLLGVLGIARDITERKQAEEHVRKLNAELELRVQERTAQLHASNKELEAFSYSVSHDLRAPLRSISGFVELLKKQGYGCIDDKGRHYMDVIGDSAVQMGRLIDDILTFSRIGRIEMAKSRVNLDQVLAEVLTTLRPQGEGRQIEWKIGTLPEVYGERTMLSLVLLNLLSNALKFTQTRETAIIEVGQTEGKSGETVCYVRDNGVGFDMQYAHKLFGLFQRLHSQDQFEGTGVGLANVQRIIQRHGGRVWAESGIDAGATFYFALPASGN